MAKLVYISTTSVDMPSVAMSPGQILYCADIPETYYDTTGGYRVVLDNIKYCFSETDRADMSVANLRDDYLYCVTSNGKFYRWSLATDWRAVGYTADIYDIIDIMEVLVPSTINQNGTKIAPKTLATQVYTKDGETVEDALNDITRVGKTYRYLEIEIDGQTEYDLPLPFANYFGLGNYIEVYIDSEWVSPARYDIVVEDDKPSPSTAKLVFKEAESVLVAGGEITVIYTYNTARVKGGVYGGVDGHYIIDGTVPITKLEKYSSSYSLDDESSVATSKAVYRSYEDINTKLNTVAGNLIAHATSYNTGSDLKADIDNFSLVDNSTIYLKLHTDIMPNATLTVNGGVAAPIYINDSQAIRAGLKAGDVLSLTYSKSDNRFYVNASVAYKLLHYRYIYECQGGESTIAINIEDFEPGYDNLHITHNNLKLIEGVNYTIDGHNLVLSYSAQEGDIIEMEMDKVSGNGLPVNGNTVMQDITFVDDVILKGTVSITDSVSFPNGGYINNEGDLYINGDISSSQSITGTQIISTVEDGIPPLVVTSTTLVENLNADMVDGYHAENLAIPDTSLEYIIDGETDLINPNIEVALRTFFGRVEALNERMMQTDADDTIPVTKQSYEDVVPDGYEWPEDEPLASELVRDTVEELVYQIDVINYRVLATETAEENGFTLDEINEMSDLERSEYIAPEPTKLLLTWDEMEEYLDAVLYNIEDRMLIVASIDADDEELEEAHQSVFDAYDIEDIEKYTDGEGGADLSEGNSRVDSEGNTQATAYRAKYLKNEGKRFYPITHRNAVVGLPFEDIATARSVDEVKTTTEKHNARLEYLEDVLEQLLSGGGETGSTGKLVMFEGAKEPVYDIIL